MSRTAAIALFSGGLDSILACRVIMAQGIRVKAIKFVTPFFGDRLREQDEVFRAEARVKYGIDAQVVDLGAEYVAMLARPQHGYGKHFNPCIDCKIFMLRRARALLTEHGASFLISGEVLGQRPMSQRHDTLRVIERESGCADILLRPLCARLLPETLPERTGLVRRDELHALRGRGRKEQMQLAAAFGITDYPTPAGGCMLTDPNLGARIGGFYREQLALGVDPMVRDIRLLLVGRQFRLPGGHWFVLGRREVENERIAALAGEDDWLLTMTDRPGPTGILRVAPGAGETNSDLRAALELAAGLIARFGRKVEGRAAPAEILAVRGAAQVVYTAHPLADGAYRDWQR